MQREAVSGISLVMASVVEVSLDLVQQVAERIDVVKAACASALPSCLKADVGGTPPAPSLHLLIRPSSAPSHTCFRREACWLKLLNARCWSPRSALPIQVTGPIQRSSSLAWREMGSCFPNSANSPLQGFPLSRWQRMSPSVCT